MHLGARTNRDVLRSDHARAALLEVLPSCNRLVLLGDVLELRHGPVRDAVSAAAPVLREIGAALGAAREVVIVPGNHDHHLVAGWLERRASATSPPPLGLESTVGWCSSDTLATIARLLAPATVRAAYPGVWLRDDVYATHGHYLDRHTTVPAFERLGAGVMAQVVREAIEGPGTAEDYEAVLGPIYAWIHAIAQARGWEMSEGSRGPSTRAWRALTGADGKRRIRRVGLVAAFPALLAALNWTKLGPLRADLSGVELRRAGLRAFGEVLDRLAVKAPYAVFGHTHRAGPLPADEPAEWRAPTGSAIINTGSWVHDPGFVGDSPRSRPYRAGFCAVVAEAGAPELTNLLDEVTLRAPA